MRRPVEARSGSTRELRRTHSCEAEPSLVVGRCPEARRAAPPTRSKLLTEVGSAYSDDRPSLRVRMHELRASQCQAS